MARPRNSRPSLIKRADGRQFVNIDGKQHIIGKPGDDQREVEKKYANLLRQIADRPALMTAVRRDRIPIVNVIAELLRSDEGPRSRSARMRFAHVSEFLSSAVPGIRFIHEIDGEAFRELKRWMIEQVNLRGGTKARWSRTSINGYLDTIKRVLRFAHSRKMVTADQLLEVTNARAVRPGDTRECPAREPVPIELFEQTIPLLSRELGRLLRVQLLTGARMGELVQMTPAMIDRSTTPWKFCPAQHKTQWRGHRREIWLGPKARRIIAETLGNCGPDDAIFSPRRSRECWQAVEPFGERTPGTFYQPGSATAVVKAYAKKHGFSRWTAHQVRHLAATRIRDRFTVEHAKACLGHSENTMTSRYTVESIRKLAIEAMEAMG